MIPKVQVYSCILIVRISSIMHIMNNIRDLCNGLDNFLFVWFFFKYLFMWLYWDLVAACRVFNLCCSMQSLSCNMWDLVP